LIVPILVSTALVFVASSIIHMALKLHNPSYKKLANEDESSRELELEADTPSEHLGDTKLRGGPSRR
jgi:hypothetical protein